MTTRGGRWARLGVLLPTLLLGVAVVANVSLGQDDVGQEGRTIEFFQLSDGTVAYATSDCEGFGVMAPTPDFLPDVLSGRLIEESIPPPRVEGGGRQPPRSDERGFGTGPSIALLTVPLDLSGVQRGTEVTVALDLKGAERPITDATPPFLDGGATFGTAATFVTGNERLVGSSAIVASGGGDVFLAGRAVLRVGEGASLYEVGFPIAEFPAGMDSMRFTFVLDNGICVVLGDPAVDDGYVPATAYSPALQEMLDERDSVHFCNAVARACLNLPGDLAITPTGEGTFDTVYQGLNFGVQFYSAGGVAGDVEVSFGAAGWTLGAPVQIAAPYRDWLRLDLAAGDQRVGALAVSDNGSAVNPAAFALVVRSPATLSAEQLAVAHELIALLADGFNSVFEAF